MIAVRPAPTASEHQCGRCGQAFAQEDAQPVCSACPLNSGCALVRCPHCGHHNPLQTAWLSRVRTWFASAGGPPFSGSV